MKFQNARYWWHMGYMLLAAIILLPLSSCRKNFEEPSISHPIAHEENYKNTAVAPGYNDVQFGLGMQYDNGDHTGVAMNSSNQLIEVHKSQSYNELWYKTGYVKDGAINWNTSVKYDKGTVPSVGMNDGNVVVEVHASNSPLSFGIFYHVGHHNGNSVSWGGSKKYDNGAEPDVAVNNNNVVVEVHKSQSNFGLFYHVGIVNPSNNTISWGKGAKYDGGGMHPAIALNNNNQVVEVHQAPTSGHLWYRVGTVNVQNKSINWGPSRDYQTGSNPSLTLLDNGYVVEAHTSEGLKDKLWSMVGQISGNAINWYRSSDKYDAGYNVSVAGNNKVIVQTHDSKTKSGLWASSTLLTDRTNWMYNSMGAISQKMLKEIVLPGSHDAGMYELSLGETQDLNIYGQLRAGTRFFDLRPDGDLHIYHGPIGGPSVDYVLSNVKQYMDEGHHELVMLKFSHFKDFNSSVYASLVEKIKQYLGPYLYVNQTGKRLAERTMQELVGDSGHVLILMDGGYPKSQHNDGIYVYRDNYSGSCADGDIVLYDEYSNTLDFEFMKNDQLNKFYKFNGVAKDGSPADMFLLSWTVTPVTDVALFSKTANSLLPAFMQNINPNQYGKVPNILYVDFCELSKATDISITLNERF